MSPLVVAITVDVVNIWCFSFPKPEEVWMWIKLTPRTSSGHCMSIITSFIHITNIGGLMQGWPISVILEKTAVSFCIEPSVCCFTLPCIKLIFSGIISCYVMYVASSSISFASLLATSSDTEKDVKLYVQAMFVYLIASFEKNTWTWGSCSIFCGHRRFLGAKS